MQVNSYYYYYSFFYLSKQYDTVNMGKYSLYSENNGTFHYSYKYN